MRTSQRFNRSIRFVVSLVALLAVIAPGVAQAKEKKKKVVEPPVSDLPNYLSYHAWNLRGKHMDESGKITGKIEKAVLDHMQQWLAEDPARAESVTARRELERIFYNLKYPTEAKPSCFDQPWKGSIVLGVGYTLQWTNYNRANVLALFEKSPGGIRLVTVTHFLPMVDLRYEFHPPVGSDDFWFFAWGLRPGKSQPRLAAILYAFNGQKLTPLWQIQDVYDGKLEVGEKKVTVRYLKEAEYIREQTRDRKPPRHLATYLLTPQGLALESDVEIPF